MKKLKRIFAWIGIILLLGMYLVTFLLGVMGNEATKDMLLASIACTVFVPVLLYAIIMLARLLGGPGKDAGEPEQTIRKPDSAASTGHPGKEKKNCSKQNGNHSGS